MSGLLQLTAGDLFAGDFRIVRPLSEGGMGAVYVVEQISTGKQRALKIMQPSLVSDERLRQRFVQEARIGSMIESDHVIDVVAAGIDPMSRTPWLAMELLRGETLADRLQRTGRLPPREVAQIFDQLGHALGAAHRAGIVHRDLKPENIFLAEARRSDVAFTVKVLDFGIAKLVAEAGTRQTAAMGTALWMAPEQTDAQRGVQPSTDVWALGLIAFHLLTGGIYWRSVYTGNSSAIALMRELVIEPLPEVTTRAAELGVAALLPPGFAAWFAQCVDREPERRFATASAATAALLPILGADVARPAFAMPPSPAPSPMQQTMPMPQTPVMPASGTMPMNASVPVRDEAPPEPPTQSRSVWLYIGIAALVGAGGVGVILATSSKKAPDVAPAASVAPSESVAPAPSAKKETKPDGAALYASLGCATCHSLDGKKLSGPRLDGWFGREIELADGTSVTADASYFRESLLAPNAKVTKGYAPTMPISKLSDAEVDALVTFLESKPSVPAEAPSASASATPPPATAAKPPPTAAPAPTATGCASFAGDHIAAMRAKEYACVRTILMPKLNGGSITSTEARYLKAACGALGDAVCEKRAAEKI